MIADVEAELAILGDAPATAFALRRRDVHDLELTLAEAGDADFLAAQPWLHLTRELAAGDVLHVRAETTVDVPHDGAPRWTATARSSAPASDRTIAATGAARRRREPRRGRRSRCSLPPGPSGRARPAQRSPRPRTRRPPRWRRSRASAAIATRCIAPSSRRGWRGSRGRSCTARGPRRARPRSWSTRSAAATRRCCASGASRSSRPSRSARCSTSRRRAIAVVGGRRVVQVRVRAGETDVALGEAIVDPLPTALVFPGQGIQRRGSAPTAARARAPRAPCGSAPTRTRARALGFSLLEVVERNPRELRLADGRVAPASGRRPVPHRVHPAGAASRSPPRSSPSCARRARSATTLVAAGHSVGEFAALHALGALSSRTRSTLVHRRGEAMQAHVPRDADGASPYRLAVVDPRRGYRGASSRTTRSRSSTTTRPAPVRGRGTADAIAALEPRLGKRAVRVLPGIDVPFHSSVLRGAVDEFRAHLRGGRRSTPSGSSGAGSRTSPAAPFAARATTSSSCWRAQLASPVRWIETQHALGGRARLIEVAPAHADVLTGLARITLAGTDVELLHAERDRDAVLDRDVEPKASGGVRPGGGAHRGGHVRSQPRSTDRGPARRCRATRSCSCSRCRRGCGSTSSIRRRRSTSSSRACRRGATRS